MHLRALRFRLHWLACLLLGLGACGTAAHTARDGRLAQATARDTPGLFLYAVHGDMSEVGAFQ